MKIHLWEDVAAPRPFAYEALTDFPRFERMLERRGAEVRRLVPAADLPGWAVEMPVAGSRRKIDLHLAQRTPPRGYRLEAESGGISGDLTLALDEVAAEVTRVTLSVELSGSGMSAKMLMGSLRVAHSVIEHRVADRLAAFARRLEDRYRG